LEKIVTVSGDPYEASKEAHALAIMTEWDQYQSLDYSRIYNQMHKPAFIFDGRNVLSKQRLESLGFEVHALGK